jgi:heptaprenyl diphosphate synthase
MDPSSAPGGRIVRGSCGFLAHSALAYPSAMPSSNPLLQLPGMDGYRARVEDTLMAVVAAEDALMAQMGSHLITAGGKRTRPLFAVASAAALADDAVAVDAAVTDDVIRGGVAVELVQVGSLCHDDVIDEADTRRGAESVNARWGNLKAILAGDFLLAKASEIAASLGTEVAGLLAATIGRLCEGEVHELRHAYDATRTEESYLAAIEGKTAALFATACRVGGIVGSLPRADIDRLTEFGRLYGMAFQVVDDVLDVIATDEQLGKPAGHDIAEGIYNLPVIRALAAGTSDLGPLLGRPIGDRELDIARKLVRDSDGVEQSLDVARAFVAEAVQVIAPFGDRPTATALRGAAEHLLLDVQALAAG